MNGLFGDVRLEDLGTVARTLLTDAGETKVWLFYGEMGSGKTTLIRELCKQLTVKDMISSPTFSIVNEYETESGGKIYHFDFYRIKNEIEALDIGVEEYFYSGNYCFIEWPEKIPSLIEGTHVEIEIRTKNDRTRAIAFSIND
jgi:tRNA threonylcarbamoyladenosine biosynthesis protein TsaE